MLINSEKFNKWLEEKEPETLFYNYDKKFEISNLALIGAMTLFLLDNGYNIEPFGGMYFVTRDTEIINYRENITKSIDLFTCLKDAIEGMHDE